MPTNSFAGLSEFFSLWHIAAFFFGVAVATAITFGILLRRSGSERMRKEIELGDLKERFETIHWELEKSNEELKVLEQGKNEFVSIVSHQLRAPVTAIKGYASMLLENSYGKIPDTAREPIEKMLLSSQHLVEMITDFLDLSKIDQGSMSYTFTAVDMKALLTELADEFSVLAHKKKLVINCAFPEKELFIVVGDEGKLHQIFSNLIDNAIKYTPKGKLDIGLEKDTANNLIRVRMSDTGIGLAQDDIYHVFGKFTRGSQGRRESTEGSGLGLYVAKKMLEAQRGKIWVDSEGPGKGSTFVIELPAEKE